MKSIHIITFCVCFLTYFTLPANSFGCSTAMCPMFPIFSSICCVMAHQCCDLALQRIQRPLPECDKAQATATTGNEIVSSPRKTGVFFLPPFNRYG